MKQKFSVTGMTCAACSARVEKVTKALSGVTHAEVNLLAGTMQAEYDEKQVNAQQIIAAITEAGYGASIAEGQKKTRRNEVQEKLMQSMKRRIIASVCLLLPLMYVSMGHMMGLPLPEILHENPLVMVLTQIVLTIPVLIINRAYFIHGFRNLCKRSPNMDSLIAVGSGASFLYGLVAGGFILYGMKHGDTELVQRYAHELYFESAAMILTLITVGKFLETRSKGKTGEAVAKLLDLAPKMAVVERDGQEVEIPAEDVQLGDIVLLRPGSRVPVDGEIIFGSASVDQGALTGESIPVEKTVGDRVAAATINKAGFVRFRADKVGEDTTLAQIIRLVEEAGGSKAPIARLADQIAGVFVPVVMAIALLAAVIWLVAGQTAEFALSIGISVLVISCPCALGLATPVAIMVGTGRAAQQGVLFKSAEALEHLHSIDTVVLDKTGTVTEGRPVVTDVISNGFCQRELLAYGAGLELGSEHPLAEAVVAKAAELGITPVTAENFTSVSGKGVTAVMDGKTYVAGNPAFLRENGIALVEHPELAAQGKTPLYFGVANGPFLGVIAVADVVKPTAGAAIEALKKDGIDVILLTGDNEITAKVIGDSLGIETVIAQVLPTEKEAKIRALQQQGRKVAMVGDGINDAPALVRADVGVAIGAGTDIAVESADVVLMRSDPMDIPAAVELSRAVIRNIRMNLFWAFFYNVLGIPIAAGALYLPFGLKLNPMIGAAAMSLSSFCVVTNALRLRLFKPRTQTETPCAPCAVKIKEEVKMETVLYVEGMMCKHCQAHVEKALAAVAGVETVTVDLEAKTAAVTGNADVAALKAAVVEAGYEVR